MSLPNTPMNYAGGIIDMGAYNGRVDLVSAPGPEVRNKMYQKAWIDNRSSKYDCPVEGIWENHTITRTFFSKENIQIIQNGIRAGVYKRSGERKLVVPPQNVDTLKIIMHSIFLQYAQYDLENIRGEIETLNKLVLDYAIPDVLSAAISYQKYLQDQSTLVVPIAHPERPDKEWKQLILRQFVDETSAPRPDKDGKASFAAEYVPALPRTYEADFYSGSSDLKTAMPAARIIYRPKGAEGIPPPFGSLL
jgi:hypothetical protein